LIEADDALPRYNSDHPLAGASSNVSRLFRYRGAANDGDTLEYVFEVGEQNSPNAVTKEKVAEIAADFMTTFYHRIRLESKKRLPEYVAKEPGNIGLRSQYSIRLYGWAKRYASVGTKRISLEDLRKLLGVESVKDADGNIIQEPALSLWANFRQRALDPPILEINNKTDLKIAIEALERAKHRRVAFVTFSIDEQGMPNRLNLC
jgi:hypothetical protein